MFKTNINLNLYKVFYEVCKYGSFSKAAEFTFTTQSSISKSIKKLESLLETELFFRHNNGIELTSKGRELLFYVEKSYGNLITAERLMMETDNLSRGKLSIGLPSYIASFFFFDKIIDFHNKYPNIEITLMNGSTSQLLDLLDKHKLDFIIDTTPIESNNKDLDVIKLLSVNYTFFTKSDSYDKYKNIKSIKDLENYNLVLPVVGTNNRDALDRLFIKYNVSPKHVINIHTSEVILNAVYNNLGIGYIISDLIKGNKDYKEIKVKESLPSTDINIAYNKKYLSSAPKRFIKDYINIDIK